MPGMLSIFGNTCPITSPWVMLRSSQSFSRTMPKAEFTSPGRPPKPGARMISVRSAWPLST